MATETKYQIEKLNNDNYFTWKFRIEMMLEKEGHWSVIEDDEPDDEHKTDTWRKTNKQAMATIALSVGNDQLVHIRKHRTAKGMWKALLQYHEKGTGNNSVQLIKEICTRRLEEGGDMEQHINWMTTMFQRIDDLGEEKLSEKWMVGILFGQLPRCYDTIVTALSTTKEDDLSLKLVQAKLIEEYKRQVERDGAKGVSGTVMKIKSGANECFFCKKKGHFKKDCEKYKKWKGNDKNKENSGQNKENKPKHKANVIDSSCKGEFLFLVKNKQRKLTNRWIIDSGASCHIAVDKLLFNTFEGKHKEKVQVADGSEYISKGMGTVIIKFPDGDGNIISANLEKVLFVPEITSNILSVDRLTKKGFALEFNENKCFIKANERIIGIGQRHCGQYELMQSQKIYACDLKKTCAHYWHRILGHRDIEVVKRLNDNKLIRGVKIDPCECSNDCDVCLEGKMTRLPFPKQSFTSTKSTVDLIHTDICGPMQTPSHGGKRYVLTFIDDFSRYTVIYLLKNKSECFEKLQEYVSMVQTLFDTKPRMFRSDRGTEYTDKRVVQFLKSNGIGIQYTAAYSPQQNGVAERKNRTLIEMSRCMLIDAKLSHSFWAEAVMTANFIQNRLPTRAVSKTPYELWTGTSPLLKNFKIFGSKCYVHIPDEKRQKLDAKGFPAIFIGYDENSKAFRCYDQSSRKVRISRDVRFVNHGSLEMTMEETEKQKESNEVYPSEVNPMDDQQFEMTVNEDPTSTVLGDDSIDRTNESFISANSSESEDWDELKRVVKYLKGTIHLKLHLGDSSDESLIGYADANWAEDRTDRKSNSGYIFKAYGAVISWCCRKQSCVALSSTEAEFMALSDACKEAIWLRSILGHFQVEISQPTIIFEDNQSCLALINQEGFSNRTKHIDTRRFFVKDHIDNGTIKCKYCKTQEMLADMCTKPLNANKLASLRNLCGLY